MATPRPSPGLSPRSLSRRDEVQHPAARAHQPVVGPLQGVATQLQQQLGKACQLRGCDLPRGREDRDQRQAQEERDELRHPPVPHEAALGLAVRLGPHHQREHQEVEAEGHTHPLPKGDRVGLHQRRPQPEEQRRRDQRDSQEDPGQPRVEDVRRRGAAGTPDHVGGRHHHPQCPVEGVEEGQERDVRHQEDPAPGPGRVVAPVADDERQQQAAGADHELGPDRNVGEGHILVPLCGDVVDRVEDRPEPEVRQDDIGDVDEEHPLCADQHAEVRRERHAAAPFIPAQQLPPELGEAVGCLGVQLAGALVHGTTVPADRPIDPGQPGDAPVVADLRAPPEDGPVEEVLDEPLEGVEQERLEDEAGDAVNRAHYAPAGRGFADKRHRADDVAPAGLAGHLCHHRAGLDRRVATQVFSELRERLRADTDRLADDGLLTGHRVHKRVGQGLDHLHYRPGLQLLVVVRHDDGVDIPVETGSLDLDVLEAGDERVGLVTPRLEDPVDLHLRADLRDRAEAAKVGLCDALLVADGGKLRRDAVYHHHLERRVHVVGLHRPEHFANVFRVCGAVGREHHGRVFRYFFVEAVDPLRKDVGEVHLGEIPLRRVHHPGEEKEQQVVVQLAKYNGLCQCDDPGSHGLDTSCVVR